jgi:hypothetical protein
MVREMINPAEWRGLVMNQVVRVEPDPATSAGLL